MSDEQLSRLFTPFEQAEKDDSRNFGGTGLGMAITRNLLELMEGNIKCHSAPGKGTEFQIRIPVGQAVPETSPDLQARARRILVVDDVPLNRLLVHQFLKKMGCTVEEAGSGEEAIEKAAAADFDMILMDIHMPGIGGLEAARRILAVRPDNCIIALSADSMPEHGKAASTSGMRDSLIKPVSEEGLRAMLEDHL